MRIIFFLLFLSFVACKERSSATIQNEDPSSKDTLDGLKTTKPDTLAGKIYGNARFKDVTVTRTGENSFLIKGKGQIFEANFGWVIEDGHDELQTGHQTTDGRAPEWGSFTFTVNVPKKDLNSTFHIILFEVSTKDGSREYELPVLLY